MRVLATLAASLLAVTALAGCAQDSVSNQTDSFSYGGQVAGKDGSTPYTWRNTQGKAMVNWGGQTASGSFVLTLKDADGKQVYSRTFSGASQGGSTDETASGRAGDWTVTLAFDDFTGQMGLSIQAKFGGAAGYCPPGVPGC